MVERRQHIFCETLKPGMDRKAVLQTLKQFGDFHYSEATWGDAYSEFYGNFTDQQIAGESAFFIYFRDGRYTGTSIDTGGFEHVESVCQYSNK